MDDDFKLELEPAEVSFAGPVRAEPTQAVLMLRNPLEQRVAYKIKCTNNQLFKIQPAVGLLAPGETAAIQLTCAKLDDLPAERQHYFAAYHIDAPDDAASGQQVWSSMPAEPRPRHVYAAFVEQ